GEQKSPGPPHEIDLHLVRWLVEHHHILAEAAGNDLVEICTLRRLAPLDYHHEGKLGLSGYFDGNFRSLFRTDPTNEEQEILFGPVKRVCREVDAVVHHAGVAQIRVGRPLSLADRDQIQPIVYQTVEPPA